jgi:hypothetical protein
MDNKYVDIILIISCIFGFLIGLFIGNYGIFIYNIIFFILIMTIILLLVYKSY